MPDSDVKFTGSIPTIYEHLLVPIIFEPYAKELVSRLQNQAPKRILETAAGTGIVTRELAKAFPAAEITATDLNQSMIDVAKSSQKDGKVFWQQADAQFLPFENQYFDAVVCQFGVMFFPDRIKGYAEARRVLKPGGIFLFDAWDRLAENPIVDIIAANLKKIYADDPPMFMERVPHGYHDVEQIERDVKAGGFRVTKVEHVSHQARARNAEEAARAWCQGTPLRNEIELRRSKSLSEVTELIARALQDEFGSRQIEAPIRALIVTAS